MTPRRGEAGRGSGASRDEARAPSAAVLAAMLLGALLLRLIIAYVLFPHSGFKVDIGDFDAWGDTLMKYGPGGFYTHAGFSDYTPGYLYVLWAYRNVFEWVGSFMPHPVPFGDPFAGDVKLPGILFDLALGWLIYRAVRPWRGERAALIAAALYLFIPVTWYESALWGQVDAVGSFVLLGSVLLLIAGWSEAAAGTAVLATLVKPQYGIVLFLVGFVLLARHLVLPGSGPRPRPQSRLAVRLNDALGGWFTVEQGPWRLVSSAAVGLLVLFVVITPFDLAEFAAKTVPSLPLGGDLGGLLIVIGQAVGQYHYLTVNAFNPWALVGPTPLAWTGIWTSDLTPAIGAVPFYVIGVGVLATGLALLGYQLLRRNDRTSILITATVLAVAVFVLPTRVHERYLFPAFALGAVAAGVFPRWRWWYVALGLANAANLHANLTNPLYGTSNVVGLPLGDLFRSGNVVALIAIATTALFAWALWHVRPAIDDVFDLFQWRRAPAGGDALPPRTSTRPGVRMVWRTPWTPPPDPNVLSPSREAAMIEATRRVASDVPPSESLAPSTLSSEPSEPVTSEVPSSEVPSLEAPWEDLRLEPPRWLSALRGRIGLPSIRPDRSRLLHGEGPGRVDRLDLLALVLILVLGMGLRVFRADQPFQMITLDEIYHARTATEFLQDWRYGIPHSIYEYTHPHLAKYLMAAGITLLGNDRVVATSSLGTPVRSVALERRYASFDEPGVRAGDRLFVASGEAVRVMDLRSGADEARIPVLATAVAVDEGAHRMYAGGASGALWSLETSALDRWREVGGEAQDIQPVQIATLGGPIDQIWALAPDRVVVRSGQSLTALDPTSGAVLSTRSLPGIAGAVALPTVATVVAHPDSISDVAAEARTLAQLLGLDAGALEARLRDPAEDKGGVRIDSYVTAEQSTAIEGAIADGSLTGTAAENRVALAAGVASGVAILDGTSLDSISDVPIGTAGRGLAIVGEGSDRWLYVAGADQRIHLARLPTDGTPPTPGDRFLMPGGIRDVRWNPATNLVHVLGETATGQPTVYVVEPHGYAVFTDAALPFTPVAWALDIQPEAPAADRERALVFAADGSAATVDVGHNAFAWRFPGILLGVLMAAALYVLARLLFRRRTVAVLASAAVLTDGMLFAHSRDAMNDAYVGFFIVAAMAVLAWLWIPGARAMPARAMSASQARRWYPGGLALALGLPLVGVLLGLGLASKWVAAYAIGAAVLLVLLRSALGRFVALAGMIVLAGVLGNLALATGNVFFAVLMLGLVLTMAAGMAWRPIEFSVDELRYAALAPVALGVVLLVATWVGILGGVTVTVAGRVVPFLAAAGAMFVGSGVVAGLALPLATRLGWIAVSRRSAGEPPEAAPVAAGDGGSALDEAPSPPAPGWLRPGAWGGLPLTYALLCLTIVPLLVYVLSYVPWTRPWDADCAAAGNQCAQIIPAVVASDGTTITEGWPPAHRGETLLHLTTVMYDYHNNLRATHPATSPWWAWPFDLKPVWLFQEPHGAGTNAVVFDAGNLVTFWLAVPAIGFGLWQAWRRRSLALAFIGVVFLAQWLSWARVDRAAFQYHYYTALPFAFLFLGYFLAELWHGPTPRTWLLARVSAAVAMLAPGLLWLNKDPLCALAGVQSVAPSSYLCTSASGSLVIPTALVGTALVLVAGLVVLIRELLRLGRHGAQAEGSLVALGRLGAIALLVGAVATVVPRLIGSGSFTFTGSIGQAWVVGLAYVAGAAAFAWLALGARDPRRYVAIVLVAAVGWLVAFYPYLADLPLPAASVFVYQRLLPTFDYSFQFAVNRNPSPTVGVTDPQGFVLVASIGLAAIVAYLLVRQWRLDRLALDTEGSDERLAASP